MPNLAPQWTHAKDKFFNAKLPASDFPPDFLLFINQGADFGPALKAFDKASSPAHRKTAIVAVLKAKNAYDKEIRTAFSHTTASGAKKALKALHDQLLAIWREAEDLAQPPRPSTKTVAHAVLRDYNLAGKVKSKYLDFKATKVEVIILIDEVLDTLIKNGQESLKIGHLGEVAQTEIEKIGTVFADTVKDIDARIERDLLDPKKRDAKVKEANEVLTHYAKIVEDRVNSAVQAEWQGFLQRRAHLRDFRIKCTVKIAFGAIGVGVAAASIALSFGTLWMNAFAVAKGITDLAQTIKTFAQDIDTVYAGLFEDMSKIHALNLQREKAKKTNGGQKASKAKEAAKELLTALLPITKNMVKSAGDAVDRSKQLLALVAKLENKADELTGKLNALVQLMSKLPERQMTADLKKLADQMEKSFEKLFDEITGLHRRAQNCGKFADKALKSALKLQKEDSWIGDVGMEKAAGTGTKGVALYALANFVFECAKNGKSLIPI